MDPYQHINALIYASEKGQAGLPRVKIELCASCHGLKFRADYGDLHSEHIVAWEQFLAAEFPTTFLCSVIDQMRAQINDRIA